MGLLRWIGGIVLVFWILGIIFRIGAYAVNFLLVLAAIVFIVDSIGGKRRNY